jgi:hypothetical protein
VHCDSVDPYFCLIVFSQSPNLSLRFGLTASSRLLSETSPVRAAGTNRSAVRAWIDANPNLDSIAVIDVRDPSSIAVGTERWLLATSVAYLQLDPFWLAAFSAGVVVPRQATFGVRVLSGSCDVSLRTAGTGGSTDSAGTDFDTDRGRLSSLMYAVMMHRIYLSLQTHANDDACSCGL